MSAKTLARGHQRSAPFALSRYYGKSLELFGGSTYAQLIYSSSSKLEVLVVKLRQDEIDSNTVN